MSQQTGKPPISDDGRFWWDGAAWQPLYSPDGAHRWDGRRWVPVAAPTGDLPAWLPAESASALHGPPEISRSEIPAEPAAALTPSSGPPARPWITWGARAVVVGAIADRLLNLQLAPRLVEAGKAEQAIATDCATPVSQPCRVALNDTYHKLDAVIQTVDKSDIPPCIQAPLQKFRNTLNTAELQLAQAVQALDRSDSAGEVASIQAFATAIAGSQADAQAVQAAFATCSKTPPPKPTGSS